MSSHHFVREDQEPALLIADANSITFDVVQQLLEWSPTVVVLEAALQEVLTWGIKLDVVVAHDANTKSLALELQNQVPIKFISYVNEKEALSTALYFLIASKQKAVNILSNETLEKFEVFSALDISVLQYGKRWSLVRSGHFEKWLTAGSALEIYFQGGIAQEPVQKDGVVQIKRDAIFWLTEL
jgi:thiamine pyrophosphokinase